MDEGQLTSAQRELFEGELPLARRLAARYREKLGDPFEYDDLESGALQGLWRAALDYEPDREIPFSAFARVRVKRSIIDEIRRIATHTKQAYRKASLLRYAATSRANELSDAALELAKLRGQGNVSVEQAQQYLEDALAGFTAAVTIGFISPLEETEVWTDDDIEHVMDRRFRLMRLEDELTKLDPRDRMIITEIGLKDRTTIDLAKELDCNQSSVSRMYWRAVGKLRRQLVERRSLGPSTDRGER